MCSDSLYLTHFTGANPTPHPTPALMHHTPPLQQFESADTPPPPFDASQ